MSHIIAPFSDVATSVDWHVNESDEGDGMRTDTVGIVEASLLHMKIIYGLSTP